MSNTPLNTSLIEQRLRDAVPELEDVQGSSAYAAVRSLTDFRPGTAFILLAAERNPAGSGPQAQRRAVAHSTFGVIVAARNYRDQLGAAALDDIAKLVGLIRGALHGWSATGCSPCIWLQGDALDSDRDTVLWCDVYTTTHVLGGTPS